MATIKSYTDIEQSKKLAEILPLESADLNYMSCDNNIILCPYIEMIDIGFNKDEIIPCWSLASLLNVLPEKYTELIKEGGMYRIIIKDLCMTSLFENPVDACVVMIEHLYKLKML